MSGAIDHDEASKMAYVVDLATRLADRILDERFSGREPEPEQIKALVRAAGLLQNLGVAWPPLVEQALHEFAEDTNNQPKQAVVEEEPVGARVGVAISRLLSTLRQRKVSLA